MSVAVIVVVPDATPRANPAPSIVATLVFEDFHVTTVVRLALDPLANVSVAVNCCVPPTLIVTDIGDTLKLNVVSVVVPVSPPEEALMVDAPNPIAFAIPLLLMVAMAVLEEAQVTDFRLLMVPSEKTAMAVYCCDAPTGI